MKKLIIALSLIQSLQASAEKSPDIAFSKAVRSIIGTSLKHYDNIDIESLTDSLKKGFEKDADNEMSTEKAIEIITNDPEAHAKAAISGKNENEVIYSILNTISTKNTEIYDKKTKKPQEKSNEINNKVNMNNDSNQKEIATDKNEEFLEKNKSIKGMVTTNTGLQYIITEKSNSNLYANKESNIYVNYRGKLTDGSEFDSSYSRGEATLFKVNRLIPGMTEALILLPVGTKATLYIPPELGYGDISPSPQIPANSILVFEVEIVKLAD